jgi:hypothetical protein
MNNMKKSYKMFLSPSMRPQTNSFVVIHRTFDGVRIGDCAHLPGFALSAPYPEQDVLEC